MVSELALNSAGPMPSLRSSGTDELWLAFSSVACGDFVGAHFLQSPDSSITERKIEVALPAGHEEHPASGPPTGLCPCLLKAVRLHEKKPSVHLNTGLHFHMQVLWRTVSAHKRLCVAQHSHC